MTTLTWYQHNELEYIFDVDIDTYNGAVKFCSEMDATLVIVKTKEVQRFLADKIKEIYGKKM